jgi:cytoskeletal protein CcmA (bactofilin family)
MLIADLKDKILSVSKNNPNGNFVLKKLGAIGASFKNTPTIISHDLKVEGNIISLGLIEIEGNVKGTIKGNSVILCQDSLIEGIIIAKFLSIKGRFDGTIKAKTVHIGSKAKITGDIEYNSLSVEDGACIDGNFKYFERT